MSDQKQQQSYYAAHQKSQHAQQQAPPSIRSSYGGHEQLQPSQQPHHPQQMSNPATTQMIQKQEMHIKKQSVHQSAAAYQQPMGNPATHDQMHGSQPNIAHQGTMHGHPHATHAGPYAAAANHHAANQGMSPMYGQPPQREHHPGAAQYNTHFQFESRHYTRIQGYGPNGQGFMQSNYVQTMQPRGGTPPQISDQSSRGGHYMPNYEATHQPQMRHHHDNSLYKNIGSQPFDQPGRYGAAIGGPGGPEGAGEQTQTHQQAYQATTMSAGPPQQAQPTMIKQQQYMSVSSHRAQYAPPPGAVPHQQPLAIQGPPPHGVGYSSGHNSRSLPQSQMHIQSPRNTQGRLGDGMAGMNESSYMHNAMGGQQPPQSKKRSFNTMMDQQQQLHDMTEPNIMGGQQKQNEPHPTYQERDHIIPYAEDQDEQEQGSRTQSLDPNDEDELEDCGAFPSTGQNQQLARQGIHTDHREQQEFNESHVNMDHYPMQRNAHQVSNYPRGKKGLAKNNSKSPSPAEPPAVEKEATYYNRSGKKQSKSKISPPSRIKDSRAPAAQKEQAHKNNNNIKRSQTGIKKLKLEQPVDRIRKSHSSDYENNSRKSHSDGGKSLKDADGEQSLSDLSSEKVNRKHQQKTPPRRNYVARVAPANPKLEASQTPKKKGGMKQQVGGSTGGQSNLKANRNKYGNAAEDIESSKRSPSYQQMNEQSNSPRKDGGNSDDELGNQTNNHFKRPIQQQKDGMKMYQIPSSNQQISRQQLTKGKKSNGKSIMAPPSSGNQQHNMSVTSDNHLHLMNSNAKKNQTKQIRGQPADLSDNSVQHEKLVVKNYNAKIKPPAPIGRHSLVHHDHHNNKIVDESNEKIVVVGRKGAHNQKQSRFTPTKQKGQTANVNNDHNSDSPSFSPAKDNTSHKVTNRKYNKASTNKIQSQKRKKNTTESSNSSSEGRGSSKMYHHGKLTERQKNLKNSNQQSDSNDSSEESQDERSHSPKQTGKRTGTQADLKKRGHLAVGGRGGRGHASQTARGGAHQDNQYYSSRGRMTRQTAKGTPTPSPQSTQHAHGRTPSSGKGQSSTRGRSIHGVKISQRQQQKQYRPTKATLNSKQQDKSKKSQILKKSDREIQKILKLYFEYVCSELITSRKIAEIVLGKIIQKTTFEDQKTIEMKVSNICFNQYTQRQDKEKRELSSQRSNGLRKVSPITRIAGGNKNSKRSNGNEQFKSYGKDFRIGDIIDLTQQKQKDKANLYLIYEIVVSLDFNGKGKTDKVDDELPDIDIKFKVHPIIQNYTMKAFKETVEAQEYIRKNIDEEYVLDKNSIVCLFEIGHRKIVDKRLEFENFVMNFQQVQKSFQMTTPADNEQSFASKLRMCRHQNSLVASTNYEKAYLIEYGYKYEDPTKIFTLTPLNAPMGNQPGGAMNSTQQKNKSNSRSTGRKAQKQVGDQQDPNKYRINIKPYIKRKSKDQSSTPSKKSAKTHQMRRSQPQEDSDSSSQQSQRPVRSTTQRKQRSPQQKKKGHYKSQKSLETEQNNNDNSQNNVKREGIRTRNQVIDSLQQQSSNSPLPKNQSLSSQNARKRRHQGRDDDDNVEKSATKKDQNANAAHDEILPDSPRKYYQSGRLASSGVQKNSPTAHSNKYNLNEIIDEMMIPNRNRAQAVKGVGGRQSSRRNNMKQTQEDKNDKNQKSRRYHNRGESQSSPEKEPDHQKAEQDQKVQQSQEREQSLTISEENEGLHQQNVIMQQSNSKTYPKEKEMLKPPPPLENIRQMAHKKSNVVSPHQSSLHSGKDTANKRMNNVGGQHEAANDGPMASAAGGATGNKGKAIKYVRNMYQQNKDKENESQKNIKETGRAGGKQKRQNAANSVDSSHQSSDHNMQIDASNQQVKEGSTELAVEVKKGRGRMRNNLSLDPKKNTTIIAINKNLDDKFGNKSNKSQQSSNNSSDVGIHKQRRRRNMSREVSDDRVEQNNKNHLISTIKEDKEDEASDVSMKAASQEDKDSSVKSQVKPYKKKDGKHHHQSSQGDNDNYRQSEEEDEESSNTSEEEEEDRHYNKRSKRNVKRSVNRSQKSHKSQKPKAAVAQQQMSTRNKGGSTSQMTTRKRKEIMGNATRTSKNAAAKSSSSEEEQEAVSAVDYELEMEEDDDVSQILMPNGNSKKLKNEYANEYDEACAKLQLNSIPSELPCRDKEQKQITDYVTQGVQNKGSSSSLYISGMPGTGKTATTLEVIRKLLNNQKGRGPHKRFEFIHINAMSLTNPNLVYTILAEKILGRRMNPQTAALFLDEFFKKKDKVPVVQRYLKSKTQAKKNNQQTQKIADRIRVLLVDELDALITQKQTLLYNLFEWPCNSNSRLLVISIANTMNLPERLQQKIQSRIGNNRLVYQAYKKEQIQEILESRLQGIKVFGANSIRVVASKVAQYSGDMRRSLQITKRSVEICRDEYIKSCGIGNKYGQSRQMKQQELMKVSVDHVITAFDESSKSSQVHVMRGLRKFEVIVLIALFLEQREEKVSLDQVQERCDTIIGAMMDFEQKKVARAQNKSFSANFADLEENLDSDFQPMDNRQPVEYVNWLNCFMTTSMFREIIKRLQAFGLINLTIEPTKLTDNAFISHFNFYDFIDLRNAFYHNEIYKVQQRYILQNCQK